MSSKSKIVLKGNQNYKVFLKDLYNDAKALNESGHTIIEVGTDVLHDFQKQRSGYVLYKKELSHSSLEYSILCSKFPNSYSSHLQSVANKIKKLGLEKRKIISVISDSQRSLHLKSTSFTMIVYTKDTVLMDYRMYVKISENENHEDLLKEIGNKAEQLQDLKYEVVSVGFEAIAEELNLGNKIKNVGFIIYNQKPNKNIPLLYMKVLESSEHYYENTITDLISKISEIQQKFDLKCVNLSTSPPQDGRHFETTYALVLYS
jgi:hypothetical protein